MIKIHIEKMTMGFRIHIPIVQAEAAVLRYAERLHAPKLGRDRGRVTTEVGDPFYLRIRQDKVYYFHLDHLQPIKDIIAASLSSYMGSYELVETTLGHVEPYKTEFKRYGFDMVVDDPESRFFYQNEVVDTASNPDRFQTIFAIQTGRGKSLAHGEKVRIPEGWKNIEELKVGDQVIGRDGKPANITGVFPQGETENYRVTMVDGRHLDVCGEHLWFCYASIKHAPRTWLILTTLELLSALEEGDGVYIPLHTPELRIDLVVDEDPYITGSGICKETVFDEKLHELSHGQKLDLISGMMDSVGYVDEETGLIVFVGYTDEQAMFMVELVRSIGGIAHVDGCRVTVTVNDPTQLFTDEEKVGDVYAYAATPANLQLRVSSVKAIGKGLSSCISIDNDDRLFIAGEWVTQHNTKSAQKTMVRLGTRTVIIVRPSYIDKWEYDTCRDKTGLKERRKRVYIVKGVQGISDMLREGRDGVLDKRRISTIMIPTTSLQLWIKDYCERPQDYTWLEIGDFYNLLKAGLVLHDEIHEHFLLVYLSAIAMNPPRLLEMSATIDPSKNKQFICERYLERFPLSARLSVDYIPVVDVAGIYYSISDPKFNAKANRMKLYSHTAYEKNLYQHGIIDQYFEMVYDLLQRGYLNNYQSGQRALVFFSLVQTCKDFKAYVDKRLAAEGHKLTTAKYNSGDSYDKFMAADIGISTPGKAGTAIDIPGLVLALVTIPIDDKQLNEQITGRPREVTAWDLTPKVLFLHCVQVSKHNRYLRSRKRELEKIVKSFKIAHSKYDLKGGKPRGINSSIHRPNIKRIPLPNSKGLSNRRGGFKGGRKKW